MYLINITCFLFTCRRNFENVELPNVLSSWSEFYKLEDKIRVGDIMTMEVITAMEDTPIEEAASLLLKHKINGLPMISRDGRLSGIITTSDILGAFAWFCRYEKKT